MTRTRSFKFLDWLLFLVVLAGAGGARAWYVCEYVACGDAEPDAVWHVQQTEVSGSPIEPLAPGFSTGKSFVEGLVQDHASEQVTPQAALRWLNVALGALTAGLFFALARRAFDSSLVGLLAGLFYAVSPFAIVNCGELQDGVAASFLLAVALALGARGGQQGGALTSYLFGLALAGLVLVRLALVPFALVTVLWYLLRSRSLRHGWLCALLAFLGFGSGLAPWLVRNYQETQNPAPVLDSAWWHLWTGNNPRATGGPMNEEPKNALPEEHWQKLSNPKEPRRYELLADLVADEVSTKPVDTGKRRLAAAWQFLTGRRDLRGGEMLHSGVNAPTLPDWAVPSLQGALGAMVILALLGWRWSYGWRYSSMPLQLAIYWIPIAYIIGHAELLHGPRLPLDGPLLCLAALAVGCVVPGVGGRLLAGEPREVVDETLPPARM